MTRSNQISDCLVHAMLGDLPSAHPAIPSGRQLAAPRTLSRPKPVKKGTHIRFVYFSAADESAPRSLYHQSLIRAEMLLDRLLAGHAAGLRAMAPTLGNADEARANVRPPRDLFHPSTLEYRRWYDERGALRTRPLTQESLANLLVAVDGLSLKEAKDRAVHRSHALAEVDQTWLIERRRVALEHRPLNQSEWCALILAIDSVYETSPGASHLEVSNREISCRVAALLGAMLDEYIAPPFRAAVLNQAFAEQHLAHLRRAIAQCQADSVPGALLIGPVEWFAAKAVRMRAEHQLGLALSPGSAAVMRLSGRPVVSVVGGRLRTFMDGWRRGHLSSSVVHIPAGSALTG